MMSGRLTLPVGLVIIGMATGTSLGPSLGPSFGQSLGEPISAKTVSVTTADDPPRGNPLWNIPVNAAPPVLPPPVSKPTEPERPLLTLVGTVSGEQEAFGIFLDQTANKIVR